MKTILPLAFALALAPVQLAWSQAPPAPASPPPCLPEGSTRYVCNVLVVEDMMVVPGGAWDQASCTGASARAKARGRMVFMTHSLFFSRRRLAPG